MAPGLVIVSEEVPVEKTLGSIVFFSMSDRDVPADELATAWKESGLDESRLPELAEAVHDFQRACSAVGGRNGKRGERVEIRADELENDMQVCSYQITRVVWDLENRVIEHEKGLRLEFDKVTHRINSNRLDHFDLDLDALENEVRSHYERNKTTIPGSRVRTAIRETILSLGAQNLRRKSGGVYFVPREVPGSGRKATEGTPTRPTLGGLANVLETLYDESGDLYHYPCMNSEGERSMLRKHVGINLKRQAAELSARAFQRLQSTSGRKPREDMIAGLNNELRTLLMARDHFNELVNMENDDVEQSLAELQDAITKLEALTA